ncbi:MAG: aldo/keto reductase [Solirubrobacterales bacterium]|nr:aldo/keto reductase [Solirubrobacterales bacterium]
MPRTVQLGSRGPRVSRVGLGAMALSGTYGPADEEESLATIQDALKAGINLLDTGDFYGMGHNELLIRRALEGQDHDRVLISVKFGAQRGPDGAWLGYDARPAALKTALAYSLSRLGVDHVDIYRPARLDPAVPIEETVGAIAELIEAGYVRYVGLSEVGSETIRRAAGVHPICDLQIEYSLVSRGIEADILPTCRELGIGVTAYGILSRGLLSGRYAADAPTGTGDIRGRMPRFQGENLERNLELVRRLAEIAQQAGSSVSQLALAWVLSRGDDIVPLIGARTREQLRDALGVFELELTEGQLSALEAAVPAEAVAGSRYAEAQMAHLDSER